MDDVEERCEICEQPARVRVLEKYLDGAPVFRHYCLECADKRNHHLRGSDSPKARPHLSYASLLIAAGLSILLLAAMGDLLSVMGKGGVAYARYVGISVGVLFVLLGALLGTDVIAVFGTIVFVLALFSNLMHVTGAAGLGWKQVLALAVGGILTAAGVTMRLRFRR